MTDTAVAIHTIGQTPRPDLTETLARRFGTVPFEVRGALDGLAQDQIPACSPDGYPLETRLRDGTRVVVDIAFLEPRLRETVAALDGRVSAHLVLCAGHFEGLVARSTLIQPFEAAVAELQARALRSLEIVVPFRAQAKPAMAKWVRAGFPCRAHVLGEKPDDQSAGRWLGGVLADSRADGLVFDYVGFPPEILEEVSAHVDLPVLDLGLSAMDALERTLVKP